MNNPTFDQAYQMLNLARDADVSLETLQALYAAGLLSDLLKAENPGAVNREEFRRILGYDPTVFRVKLGGPETTDDIAQHLRDGGFNYVNEYITQENFPLKVRQVIEEVEIEIIDPGKSFSEEEGLAILKEAKLERPTYEQGIRFAHQHGKATTSAKKPFVVFLHGPWRGPRGSRRVVCLDRRPEDRGLYLSYPDSRFDGSCVLAGVRPRKQ